MLTGDLEIHNVVTFYYTYIKALGSNRSAPVVSNYFHLGSNGSRKWDNKAK